MSRHQRRTDSGNTRSRIVLGSAMTAVFLSGGAGVALADTGGHDGQRGTGNTQSSARGGDSSNDSKGGLVGQITGPLLSNNTGQALSNNSFLNDNLNGNDVSLNILSHQDKGEKHEGTKHESKKHDEDKGKHQGGKHHWVDRDRDGCDDEDGHRWHDRDHDGRDDDDSDDANDTSKDDSKDDQKDDQKDTKAEDAKDDTDAKDDSKPKVEDAASESPAPSTDSGATPVGAADTGDGSFIGGVQPVASSWSTGDTMLAAGGGLAAVGLLAGAGVGMGRHRRTAHRHSA